MEPVYDSPPKKLKRAMEVVQIPNNGTEPVAADPVTFARSYQIEALEQALEKNTIVFLETGAGKTLVAIMLLRSYAYLLRKPSRNIAVFLVPTVVLVSQQAKAVRMNTDLEVGEYWGEMGVDYWDGENWEKEQKTYEVLVMTPMILLNALRHSFLSLENIKVLIFDECHNARGKHPYACIMMEFYHCQKGFNSANVPRILGMTASPVKAKASSSSIDYLQQISELENLMNSKVYTIVDESVLAKFIPFSTTKLKLYNHVDIPYNSFESAARALKSLKEKHEFAVRCSNLQESAADSTKKKLSKLYSNLLFCMNELGLWLALKAAETLSREGTDIFSWGKLDVCCETVIRDFSSDASKIFSDYMPSGPLWSIGVDMKADMDAGYLSSKVICLIDSLLGYKNLKDLRSIIFVERVITAFVIPKLLNVLFPALTGWNTDYTAGNFSGLQSQSRKQQNNIVEEFRKGTVNIIVATSILEEGLDVQSCNLVIRFDPSSTVCSFIQSRGRARMEKSEFLLMVRSQDTPTINRMKDYIVSGEIMRKESLRRASLPCSPFESKMLDGFYYRVESTGAVVTLNSSVALIYFYCSRLPSDGYFKPNPRCKLDKELGSCTLNFPKNCPIGTVTVEGNPKMLKQLACLEACKQLHQIGALTDHLVPYEEAEPQELGSKPYFDEQAIYFPPELVSHSAGDSAKSYHCYLIELVRNFEYDIPVRPILLAVRTELGFKDENVGFELEVDRGNISVQLKYVGEQTLTIEQVHLCRRFQTTLLRILLDHDLKKLMKVQSSEQSRNGDLAEFDYLVLPSNSSGSPSVIDWKCVFSVLFPCENFRKKFLNFGLCKNSNCRVNTKNGLLCRRMLENSLVYTPHNGRLYVINGTLDGLDGNSLLRLTNGEEITYKEYYKLRYGIDLCCIREPLLRGKQIFPVKNYLLRSRKQKERESSNTTVELPPELCYTIMSPISIATVYSFSFVPSIMHRIESLLIAINLRKMHLDHCKQNVIPATKVLEAITAKKCQETFHLESLETLGDSFLKYAACQQLFKTYQTHHEGLLSIKKDKIISNNALRKLGCDRKLPGFIRNEPFDPNTWIIPGDQSKDYILNEELLSSTGKVYNKGSRTLKSKTVADVVEALIGAFLSSGGEPAALMFMDWLGIKVDFVNTPYERHFPVQPEKHMNIKSLEGLLGYSFRDSTLLLEALTHGSYMLPEIPRCYQRLEFLGDAVLDYLITRHLYYTYPWLSPGLLTDLRSASVNNDCYAQSALRAGLHKHVLHASQELHRHIVEAVQNFEESKSQMTFGWESESTLPKVLGDIIESLAGAILVDSGYNKDILFPIMKRLLEPMITPDTMKLHPIRELTELCQKERYILKKSIVSLEKRVASITVEVEANGVTHKHTCTAADKKTAKKLASKAVLMSLKKVTSSKDSRMSKI